MGNEAPAFAASSDGGRNGAGPKSPHEARSAEKHHARRVEDADNDPQAPWNTHLEYSVDPSEWEDDEKHRACPLCKGTFVVTLIGSGRHHCRMCGVLCCAACSKGSLDLPGYDGSERVCDPCKKQVLSLRTFFSRHQEALINNMHHNRDAVDFRMYHGSGSAWRTEVWLAQSLLLLMWRERDDSYAGVPVSSITKITEGFQSSELLGRRNKSFLCCFSSVDDEFAAKENCLFSVHLSDGRTLDFEADSAQVRGLWVERLRGLQVAAAPFVSYHMDAAHYKLHYLLDKEKERLSMKNVLKQIAKSKEGERSVKNQKSNAIKQKYAQRKG
jgi:hypothetical protein